MSIPIFFSSAVISPPRIPAIVITPINPGWNDFSYNFRALISVYTTDSDEAAWSTPGFVVPLSGWEPERKLSSWIASLPLPDDPKSKIREFIRLDENPASFISLFCNESAYHSFAQAFSELSIRSQVLSALNEVLFLQNSDERGISKVSGFQNLLASQAFSLGVLRDSSAFRAFHRGGKFLFNAPVDFLEDAAKDFSFSYLTSSQFFHKDIKLNFQFHISTILEDRVHCLIGVNGTGKSRLMRELIFEAAKKFTSKNQTPLPVSWKSSVANVNSDMPAFNRVIVFSSDAEDRFPRSVEANTSFEYIYFNLIESKKEKNSRSLVKSLVGIIREGQEIDGRSRLSIATAALKNYVNFDNIYLPVLPSIKNTFSNIIEGADGKLWIRASSVTMNGEQKKIEITSQIDSDRELIFYSGTEWDVPISSGQRVYLRFILQLLGTIDTGTLVLMDEPENHLHPNLVCDMMTMLYKALSSTQSIAIVATHSAYVVREVPSHCVQVLKGDEDGTISVEGVYLKTLGAGISQISQAVFGDSTASKYHQLIAAKVAENEKDIDQIVANHANDLNPEMLSAIRLALSRATLEFDDN